MGNRDKGKKTKFRFFTIADFELEEAFLRKQHQQGYRFERYIFPGFYRFKACEPEDVVYQLELNNTSLKEQKDYLRLCRDCGWEYITDAVGWSYFRKPAASMDGQEQIFSDAQSKIEHLKRIYKSRVLPLIIIFLTCLVPQLFLNMERWQSDPSSKRVGLFFTIFFGVFFLLYVILFLHMGINLYRLEQKYKKE